MTAENNLQLTPSETVWPDCPSQAAADKMKLVNYEYDGKNRVGIDPIKIKFDSYRIFKVGKKNI